MKRAYVPFLSLVVLSVLALFVPTGGASYPAEGEINAGDTAWMLTASALVLLMTPGLSFFYGGMVGVQERGLDHAAERGRARRDQPAVGVRRLQPGLRR